MGLDDRLTSASATAASPARGRLPLSRQPHAMKIEASGYGLVANPVGSSSSYCTCKCSVTSGNSRCEFEAVAKLRTSTSQPRRYALVKPRARSRPCPVLPRGI